MRADDQVDKAAPARNGTLGMPSSKASQRTFPFALLSLGAAPVSWATLIASGRAEAGAFTESGGSTMFALLWVGAAVAFAGLVFGIAALRARDSHRLLAVVGLALCLITLAVYAFLGLFWVALSI
jgi:hypothetical protein